MDAAEAEEIVVATRTWLEKAVIGLNLCPFAKAVHLGDRIRYAVSVAETPEELRADLVDELRTLAEADPEEIETTLLIHPRVFADFLDYNDFLAVAEGTVEEPGPESLHFDKDAGRNHPGTNAGATPCRVRSLCPACPPHRPGARHAAKRSRRHRPRHRPPARPGCRARSRATDR